MSAQFLRPGRRAVCGKVRWRRADLRIAMPQRSGDQVGVQLIGDADGQIDAFTHQVHRFIANLQIHRSARIALQVGGDRRRQNRLRQGLGAGNAHHAARFVDLCVGGQRHGIGQRQ